jgi:hypothetical protein
MAIRFFREKPGQRSVVSLEPRPNETLRAYLSRALEVAVRTEAKVSCTWNGGAFIVSPRSTVAELMRVLAPDSDN